MKRLVITSVLFLLFGNILHAIDFESLETVYYPEPTDNSKTYYLNGIPLSAVYADSSYIMMYLETGKIAGETYAKLWLLYQNLSEEPYLLEPLNHVKLTIQSKKKTYPGLIPVPPSQILKSIDNQKNALMILQAIGGALKTISTELSPETTIRSNTGEEYQVDDNTAGDKVISRTRAEMLGTAYMYETFKKSVNNGILRKNTIFPNNSVTGNVYFHLGSVSLKDCTKIILYATTKDGVKVINFKPTAGE
ncbi:MAG: hypothetical protein MUF78_03550 [Candidatus Edwardsbacteria bacterium]|jgi:hypothetical protein|nr:hypothetical protein [Candidatus Edwardsbacteria bacterium]